MADITVSIKGGGTATFPEGTPPETIKAAMAKMNGPVDRVLMPLDDGGAVYERPNGSRYMKSPSYATSDPAIIERMMEDNRGGPAAISSQDKLTIAQNPVAARGTKAVEGFPVAGQFMDEAVGMFSPEARDAWRATSNAMGREKPLQSLGLNVAGALPAALIGGPAALQAADKLTRAGKVAAFGAAGAGGGMLEGAISGYGSGTDAASRAEGAERGAKWGGGIGLLAGGSAPLVGDAVTAIATKLKGLKNSTSRAVADALGISPEAAEIIKRHIDTGDYKGAMARLTASGDDAMLAEANEGAAALLDAAGQRGAGARIMNEALDTRMAGANTAFNEVADQTMGKPLQGLKSGVQEVQARTAPARKAAYDKAFRTPIDYASPQGAAIEDVVSRIEPEKLDAAVKIANAKMRWSGDTNRQMLLGPDGRFVEKPNIRQLNELKLALDEVAEEGRNALGVMSPAGRFSQDQATALRDAATNASDPYRKALEVGGDTIRERNAMELGTKILRDGTTRDEVIREMAGALPIQRQAALAGLRMDIDERLGNIKALASDPNVEARQVRKAIGDLSSPNARTKIRAIMPRAEADKLFSELDRLSGSIKLRAQVSENSKTARRTSIDDEIKDTAAGGMVKSALRAEPIGATRELIQALTGETQAARQLREHGLSAEIATALTKYKGETAKRMLTIINKAIADDQVTEAEAKFIGNLLASLAAGTGYGAGTGYPE